MATHKVVFIFKDLEYLTAFLRGIPRPAITEVLRHDTDIRNRHFRGFQISDKHPDLHLIARAFQREIVDRDNQRLVHFLGTQWIKGHEALALDSLNTIGVTTCTLADPDWLGKAQSALVAMGHLQGARRIARTLGVRYAAEDITLFVGLIGYECDDQDAIKMAVEQELAAVKAEPGTGITVLQQDIAVLELSLFDISRDIAETKEVAERSRTSLEAEASEYTKEIARLETELSSTNVEVSALRDKLTIIQTQLNVARDILDANTVRRDKARKQLSHLQEQAAHTAAAHVTRLESLEASYHAEEEALRNRREALRALEEQVRLAEADAISKATATSTLPVATEGKESSEQRPPGLPDSAPSSKEWFQRVIDRMTHSSFSSSCATLEILRDDLAGLVAHDAATAEPEARLTEAPASWAAYCAQLAVSPTQPWGREVLAKYSFARSFAMTEPSERLTDLVMAGVYHAAHVDRPQLKERLLRRLLELWAGLTPDRIANARPAASGLSDEIIQRIETCTAEPQSMARFGEIQAKLITADPKTIYRLYELLSVKAKVMAKRSLVAHLASAVPLDDRDPTHEVLDMVIAFVGGATAPWSGAVRSWWQEATFGKIVKTREALLASFARSKKIFSRESHARLEHARDLFGREISEAKAQNTPAAYEALLHACASFGAAELHAPELISARFLFPIIVELGRCTLHADREMRSTQRAELTVSLDKNQQPISAARTIEVGLRVVNDGNAAADGVNLFVMAARSAGDGVDVPAPEFSVQRIVPGPVGIVHRLAITIAKPSPGFELEYVATWADSSASKRTSTGAVKVIAQRQIDWEKASINPYTLRSITDPHRLYGRDDVMKRLELGVMGVQSFYITGQKRVGKSSVGRVLYRTFVGKANYLCAYVPLGELNTRSAGAMIYSLQSAVVEASPDSIRPQLRSALGYESDFGKDVGSAARTLVRAIEEHLPSGHVLCVIDDFDELDESLYKGSDAATLFLYLRSLIDRGTWSLVLVGSEKLPEILRYQGERLNQVTRLSVDYLTHMANVAHLLKEPAAEQLEFAEEAVDLIYRYSAGNPYYATLIAKRVYEEMVTRRDHYVGSADVEAIVAAVMDEESVSTFQHFWKDGIFEAAANAEEFQLMNAQLLIACAELETHARTAVKRPALVAHSSVRSYDQFQLEYRIDNLINRKVLEENESGVLVRVPLLASWLRGLGAPAARDSFGERDRQLASRPSRRAVEAFSIFEVAKGLIYMEKEVSDLRIKAWLDQFGSERAQEWAFRLLRRLREKGYYNDAKMYSLYRTVHALILADEGSAGRAQQIKKRKVTNVFVSHLDADGKSGSSLLYAYRIANQIPNNFVGSLEDAVRFLKRAETPSAIIFVDDFMGSGGTVMDGYRRFREILGTDLNGGEHRAYAAVLAGMASGKEAVSLATGGELRIIIADELGSADRAFSPEARIFDSDLDRIEAEKLCRAIGQSLEPRQPLGFDDSQMLLTFSHRCPNNTLPIFYKDGKTYQGRPWIPLFPR